MNLRLLQNKPYYLGLEINRDQNGLNKVTQGWYTRRILERFGMSEWKPVSIPIIKETIESDKVQHETEDEDKTE